jgi:formylmethanofuran dehydrogenase subunit E-like metal-binding protein
MDSDVIKGIVAKVNQVCSEEDQAVRNTQINEIMSEMTRECGKSLTFAVAIIQHLTEAGIPIMEMDLENSDDFRAKFQAQVQKMGERELLQIRKISNKLFA